MAIRYHWNRLAIAAALSLVGAALLIDAGRSNLYGENIVSGMTQDRIDRLGRYLGAGWGDGYHACNGSGRRLGADIPPVGARTISRRTDMIDTMETFYDRFDARQTSRQLRRSRSGEAIHPSRYRVRNPNHASSHSPCDECGESNCQLHGSSYSLGAHWIDEITSPEAIASSGPSVWKPDSMRETTDTDLGVSSPAEMDSTATRLPQQLNSPTRLPRVPTHRGSEAPTMTDSTRPSRLPRIHQNERVASQPDWNQAPVQINQFSR